MITTTNNDITRKTATETMVSAMLHSSAMSGPALIRNPRRHSGRHRVGSNQLAHITAVQVLAGMTYEPLLSAMQAIQPRVSKRISIQWAGQEAAEETDTLVLTFPTHYLDLRVYRQGHAQEGQVEWAQAGEVKHIDDGAGEYVAPRVRGRLILFPETPSLEFIPLINSVPPPPPDIEKLPDQGSFRTLSNEDVEERGTMFNPKTIRNENYIEIWRRMALRSPYAGQSAHPPSLLVGRSPSDADRVQAYVGYIGQFALGIACIERSGGEGRFIAWREEYDSKGKWRRVFSIGSDGELARYVPSVSSFAPGSLHDRDSKIVAEGPEWIVLHSSDHQ